MDWRLQSSQNIPFLIVCGKCILDWVFIRWKGHTWWAAKFSPLIPNGKMMVSMNLESVLKGGILFLYLKLDLLSKTMTLFPSKTMTITPQPISLFAICSISLGWQLLTLHKPWCLILSGWDRSSSVIWFQNVLSERVCGFQFVNPTNFQFWTKSNQESSIRLYDQITMSSFQLPTSLSDLEQTENSV